MPGQQREARALLQRMLMNQGVAQGRGNEITLPPPGEQQRGAINNTITNFINTASDEMLRDPEVRRMLQTHIGDSNLNAWFTQRFGRLGRQTDQERAVQRFMGLAAPGSVGMSSRNPLSPGVAGWGTR